MSYLHESMDELLRRRLNQHLALRYEIETYVRDAEEPWPDDAPAIEPFVPCWSMERDRPARVRVLRTRMALKPTSWAIYSDDEYMGHVYSQKRTDSATAVLRAFGYHRLPNVVTYTKGRRSVGAKLTLSVPSLQKGVGQ